MVMTRRGIPDVSILLGDNSYVPLGWNGSTIGIGFAG
jgi:hypothetical protein